ncbi:MAG TPA: sulfite exporter TauE/SafE family protein [Candidatus Binatia bacterium]|nr:sulfite exporter TauE/SafE family protein [Candidatus Binatia bacterium]
MTFDLNYVLVGASLLIAAFIKGATGLGFPLIATPALALLLDIRTAVTVLILPNLFMDSAQVTRDGLPYDIFRRFSNVILPTIVGVFLGTLVLVRLPLWILNFSLGIMVLAFVFSNLLQFHLTISPRREKFLSPVFGFISGFLNGMTNAAGPTLAIYLYSLKLDKRTFVKSLATIFVITKLTQLIAISTWNLFNRETITLSVQVLLFTLAGFYAGIKAQDRINQVNFNRGLLALLCAIGMTLVARALSQAA